jgi:hypothetical protein
MSNGCSSVEKGESVIKVYRQGILSPAKDILPDVTERDESIFTGLAAVKVRLRPVYVSRQNVVILASPVLTSSYP